MKKWILVDDCTTSRAACFETILNAETKTDAIAAARIIWEKMSDYDKKNCDDFYVAYGVCDDGIVDYDTFTEIEYFK